MGKDKEGNVRALSWQTTPGGIYYKRSIAKKVLGTDDPKKIGGMMNSMDGVFEVAAKMKQKGYKMFPDEGSIRWFVQGNDPQPWVNDKQELVLTDARKEYMDYAKELRTKQYTALAFLPGLNKKINRDRVKKCVKEKGLKPIIWNVKCRGDIYSFSGEETSCVRGTYRIGSSLF